MIKIFLTRHGETIENKEGRLQGQMQGTLSELGIEQAKKLARRLSKEKFDKIISSDLARAADTAKEIAKFHAETPIEFTEEIRERNWGELQGMLKKDLEIDPIIVEAGTMESKEGEKQELMFERANKFIKNLIENEKGTILLVAHHGINMALDTTIRKGTFEDYLKSEKQDNCAINIYTINEEGETEVELFNDSSHLSE